MAGMNASTPTAIKVVVHRVSRVLELEYSDGRNFRLPFEYLRVYSPSAEVRGHGPGQEVLQVGKEDVTIQTMETVGNYAVQPVFSDGHNSGIYTWDYLYYLGHSYNRLWPEYLARLEKAGKSRQAAGAMQSSAVQRPH